MPEINFFWDPLSDNILQERDETGAVTAEYTTEPGLYGNLISQNQSGVESQHHFDALGSTLALTDDDQQVTDTNAYTAFGEVTERSGSTTSPFQFLGKRGIYSDSHVNECYTRRSSYQPSIARVLSSGLSLRMTRPLPSVSLQAAYFPSPYGHLFSYALFGLAASGDGDSNESGQPPGGKATGGNVCAFVAWFAPLKDRDKGEDLHRFGICQAKCVAEKANRKFTVVSVQEVLDLITNSKCCTLYACCHQGGDKGNLGGCYTYGGKDQNEPVFIFGPKAKEEINFREAFRAAGCKDCVINIFACGGSAYTKEEADEVKRNRQTIADNTCCKVCGSVRPVGLRPDPVQGEGGILGSKYCPVKEWVEGRPAWKHECVEPKVGLDKCGQAKGE